MWSKWICWISVSFDFLTAWTRCFECSVGIFLHAGSKLLLQLCFQFKSGVLWSFSSIKVLFSVLNLEAVLIAESKGGHFCIPESALTWWCCIFWNVPSVWYCIRFKLERMELFSSYKAFWPCHYRNELSSNQRPASEVKCIFTLAARFACRFFQQGH